MIHEQDKHRGGGGGGGGYDVVGEQDLNHLSGAESQYGMKWWTREMAMRVS